MASVSEPGPAPGVLEERHGPVVVLILHHPERRNALSAAIKRELADKLLALSGDRECRAIVLTGSGGTFCSGGDINELRPMNFGEKRVKWTLHHQIIQLLLTGPKPVVAAVEGYAYGAGISVAAACDHIVVASNAQFSCAFIRMALLPDLGLRWTLSQRVGWAKAKQLAMFGTVFDGEEAGRIGLADRVVAPGQALAAAIEAAQQLAEQPGIAMALLKSAFATRSGSLEEALRADVDYSPVLAAAQDHEEAKRAFREKRKPRFTGD